MKGETETAQLGPKTNSDVREAWKVPFHLLVSLKQTNHAEKGLLFDS